MRVKTQKGIFRVKSIEFFSETRFEFNGFMRKMTEAVTEAKYANAIKFNTDSNQSEVNPFAMMPTDFVLGNLDNSVLIKIADDLLKVGYFDITTLQLQSEVSPMDFYDFGKGYDAYLTSFFLFCNRGIDGKVDTNLSYRREIINKILWSASNTYDMQYLNTLSDNDLLRVFRDMDFSKSVVDDEEDCEDEE